MVRRSRRQTRRQPRRQGGGGDNNHNPLNNSYNLTPEDLENLHVVNTTTPEWSPVVGNNPREEIIPRNLQWSTRVVKLRMPPMPPQKAGRHKTKRRSMRHKKRRIRK
jgi:hypothetical protein